LGAGARERAPFAPREDEEARGGSGSGDVAAAGGVTTDGAAAAWVAGGGVATEGGAAAGVAGFGASDGASTTIAGAVEGARLAPAVSIVGLVRCAVAGGSLGSFMYIATTNAASPPTALATAVRTSQLLDERGASTVPVDAADAKPST
jgi:hypothetical protein